MASFSLSLDDDLVVRIASYGAPEDLLHLALTCRRLGSKTGSATGREWRRMARDAKRQKTCLHERSLMDEAARCVAERTTTADERRCVPNPREGGSWMGRYHELLRLRRRLTFDHLIGPSTSIVASQDNTEVRIEENNSPEYYCTALSSHIMRAGRHYASFTWNGGDGNSLVGIFRPPNSLNMERVVVEGPSYLSLLRETCEKWGGERLNHCALQLSENGFGIYSGGPEPYEADDAFPFDWQFHLQREGKLEEREGFEQNDTVGMLLDLDEGSLTIYKNGRKLGLMKSGLAGEFCWGATLACNATGASAKICRELLINGCPRSEYYEEARKMMSMAYIRT